MKFAICIALTLWCITTQAQNAYYIQDIPVLNVGGDTLSMGNAGGLNAPQFSEIDLNNDGVLDLLVYDRIGKIALTFLNNGTPNQVDYVFAPIFMDAFPQGTSNFMLARDYNCDGIQDLFFYNRPPGVAGGVGVWRGYYDASGNIAFEEVADRILYQSSFSTILATIFIYNPDVPAIADVDGDGDIDILAFALDFTFDRNVQWYRNMSVENGYGCDSLDFVLEHQCWGLFSESGLDNQVFLSSKIDSCADNIWWRSPPSMGASNRHIGSTLTLVDYDANGTQDLIMGDVQVNHLNLISTTLVNDTLLATNQDVNFPAESQRVDLFSLPSIYFLDVNNDGQRDALVAPTETAVGEAVTDSVVWWYKNTSATAAFSLDFQQKDFLVGEMIDLGQGAYPVFIDVNADGLDDLLVGNIGYCQPDGSFRYGMTLFEQALDPVDSTITFQLTDFNYANLDTLALFALVPTTADIDNDGDLDLLLGDSEGELIFLENLAGADNVAVWQTPVRNYMGIDPGSNSAPEWVDIDRDGDFDLMVGENNGNINYFQNNGTPQSPMYSSIETDNFIGEFDLNVMGSGYSIPRFVDNNGEYELFLGHRAGGVVHLGNIDGNILGAYDTLSMNFEGIYTGNYSAPAFADLDGNDTLEMVLGNVRGGLAFYSNSFRMEDNAIATSLIQQELDITLFPNPTTGNLYLQLGTVNYSTFNYKIYNVLGQILKDQYLKQVSDIIIVDIQGVKSGVYYLQILADGRFKTIPFRVE